MKPVLRYKNAFYRIFPPSQAVIWRGPMASKALNQMIFDADWEN
jgi:ATP-binding protein involved in chromosome partitioning